VHQRLICFFASVCLCGCVLAETTHLVGNYRKPVIASANLTHLKQYNVVRGSHLNKWNPWIWCWHQIFGSLLWSWIQYVCVWSEECFYDFMPQQGFTSFWVCPVYPRNCLAVWTLLKVFFQIVFTLQTHALCQSGKRIHYSAECPPSMNELKSLLCHVTIPRIQSSDCNTIPGILPLCTFPLCGELVVTTPPFLDCIPAKVVLSVYKVAIVPAGRQLG